MYVCVYEKIQIPIKNTGFVNKYKQLRFKKNLINIFNNTIPQFPMKSNYNIYKGVYNI